MSGGRWSVVDGRGGDTSGGRGSDTGGGLRPEPQRSLTPPKEPVAGDRVSGRWPVAVAE